MYRDRSTLTVAREVITVARKRGVDLGIGPEEDWLTAVQRERVIEEYLEHGLQDLEPGLRLAKINGKRGRQFSTRVGPVDLLAVDANNRYVVVELKKGQAADKVIGQLLRYIGALVEEYGWENMRGFVVTESIDKRLRVGFQALIQSGSDRTRWRLYGTDFKIRFKQEEPPHDN